MGCNWRTFSASPLRLVSNARSSSLCSLVGMLQSLRAHMVISGGLLQRFRLGISESTWVVTANTQNSPVKSPSQVLLTWIFVATSRSPRWQLFECFCQLQVHSQI